MLKFFAITAAAALALAIPMSANATPMAGKRCPGGPKGGSQRSLYDGTKNSTIVGSQAQTTRQTQQGQSDRNK